jgi:putative ABC transport system permease protein
MKIHIHLRRLLRSRVFLTASVLVVGLGLGVNMTLFNTVYALLWRPLTFAEPDRLVTLSGRSAAGELSRITTGQHAWTLHQQAEVIQDTGLASSGRLVTLFNGDEAMDLPSAAVNSGYFKALGLRPVAGSFFGEAEDRGENPDASAVLTEATWRTQFGSDPAVVGRVFTVQEGAQRRALRVIGIAPGAATLPFASEAEILLPIPSASAAVRTNLGTAQYHSVVRLRPGVGVAQASARIDAALDIMERSSPYGVWGRHWLEPLRPALAPVNRGTILLLYGSACLLLLLTCTNLASLFVARAMARAHETSVHLALGATRWRLLSAHFQEALLVCALGTGLAFTVESWTRPLIPKFIPAIAQLGPELLAPGPVLLAFGILICLGISLVVSATGLRLQTGGLALNLSQGGRGGLLGAGRFRAVLAAAQLAIVLTLLTLAGMVGRSFLSAMGSAPGVDPKGVFTFQAFIHGSLRPGLPAAVDLADRIAALPGAQRVAFAAELPVGSTVLSAATGARAGNVAPGDPQIAYRLIGPSYFETLGAQMAAGRTFSAEDIRQSRPVVILNQTASRLLYPGEGPLGRTLQPAFLRQASQVVGVVKDIRTEGLDQAPAPMVYMPYLPYGTLTYMVRTGSAPGTFLALLKARGGGPNSGVLIRRFRRLKDILDDTVRERMIAGGLVGGFALLGLIISSVGLYGTLSAHVQQRRREIGVRIALGAPVHTVVATVLRDGMRIMLLGALAGVAASAAAAALIRPQLYGVGPFDPASFAAALALLSSAALVACLIPAFEAARVDPIQALNVQ